MLKNWLPFSILRLKHGCNSLLGQDALVPRHQTKTKSFMLKNTLPENCIIQMQMHLYNVVQSISLIDQKQR